MTGEYCDIAIEAVGAIDIVTLDRPAQLNAMTSDMISGLTGHFRAAVHRPECRVILLRGEGRAFCAGIDLERENAGTVQGTIPDMYRVQESLSDLVLAMRRCPQPIIALVHGGAAGGGFALALASDVRLATPAARFIPSFVKIGLSAGDCGLSYFLPRIVGRAHAAQIMLAGQTVQAERALTIALVAELVEEGRLIDAGMALAGEMLNASPMGLSMTKDLLNLNADAPSLEAALAIENRTQVLLGRTDDLREGVAAFLEKRPPDYRGR
jgi:enoyl-CoA hydratase/carnithine racemase